MDRRTVEEVTLHAPRFGVSERFSGAPFTKPATNGITGYTCADIIPFSTVILFRTSKAFISRSIKSWHGQIADDFQS